MQIKTLSFQEREGENKEQQEKKKVIQDWPSHLEKAVSFNCHTL